VVLDGGGAGRVLAVLMDTLRGLSICNGEGISEEIVASIVVEPQAAGLATPTPHSLRG
jgi:hypothetical protein